MPEKSEARNPKSETNSKSEKAPKLKTARGGLVLPFGFRSFGFVSNFEVRISDFEQGHDPYAE